jgi:hypothetical protein
MCLPCHAPLLWPPVHAIASPAESETSGAVKLKQTPSYHLGLEFQVRTPRRRIAAAGSCRTSCTLQRQDTGTVAAAAKPSRHAPIQTEKSERATNQYRCIDLTCCTNEFGRMSWDAVPVCCITNSQSSQRRPMLLSQDTVWSSGFS